MKCKAQKERPRLAQKHSRLEARRKLLVFILLSAFSFQLSAFLGCEAFRKRFVRKPKKKQIRVVVSPQEYTPEHSAQEVYKKHFLFWRASHDELIDSLDAQDANRKKRISSAKKIIENLRQMHGLLTLKKQARLDIFILEQEGTLRKLDRYNLSLGRKLRIKSTLNKQRRQIEKVFDYRHIQEYLIQR